MTYHVKISGAWKTITANYVKISGTWRPISNMWVKISDAWRPLFSSATNEPTTTQAPTLETNSSNMPATLTGKNYRWTNATVLTYKFQYYTGSQWLDGNGSNATGTITNPSVGSFTPKTYTPIIGDFPSSSSTSSRSFRFVVTATNTNVSPSLQTVSPSNTITIENVVAPPPTEYTITWNANGGTVSPASNTVNAGSSVTAPTPTRDGYTFSNWRNPLSGDLYYTYQAGAVFTPTESFTLYAIWTPIVQYTITFNANGGTVSPASTTVNSGQSVTAPTPTRSGYTFSHWRNPASGDLYYIYYAGNVFTPTESFTLYAIWTAIVQYTITWNANGGTVSPTSTTVNSGQSVTAPTPTRDGYTFSNWRNPLSGDLYYTYQAGAVFTPTESFTLYAIWTASVVVPTGGSVSLTGSSTPGSVITASTSGWSGSPTSYSVVIRTALSTPTESSTIVAFSVGGASECQYTITTFDAVSPVNIFKAFATASNSAGSSSVVSSGTISATPPASSPPASSPPASSPPASSPPASSPPASSPPASSPPASSPPASPPSGCFEPTSNCPTGTYWDCDRCVQ